MDMEPSVSATPAPVTSEPKASKSRKGLGLALIIWPPVIIVGVFLVGFFVGLFSVNYQESVIEVIFYFLELVCILGILISIPIGVILIVKSSGRKFYMKEAVKFGWETMKKNFWLFFAVLITMFAVNVISSFLGYDSDKVYSGGNQIVVAFIISIVFGVLHAIMGLGAMSISLKLVDGKEAKYVDLFMAYKLFLKYVSASIVYSLIIFAGIILLIVPAIIWQMKYMLYPYFLLEGAGPIEALKKSGQATKGAKAELFVFNILLGLIGLAGAIAIFIGLLWALPTVFVAMAYVYRQLQKQMTV